MLTLSLFYNYLFSKRSGALIKIIASLCILGTGVGVMALVIVLSVMNGFNNNIQNRLLSVEPHLVVPISSQSPADKSAVDAALKSVPSVPGEVSRHRYERQDVIVKTAEGLFGGGIAYGLSQDRLFEIYKKIKKRLDAKKKSSRFAFSRKLFELQAGEIIMGVDLARNLQIFEGDEITLIPPESLLLPKGQAPPYAKLRVKTLLSADLPEIDGKYIYFNLDHTMLSLRQSRSRESGLEMRISDPMNYRLAKATLLKSHPQTQTWVDRNSSLFFALKMEKLAMSIFLGLSALITSFSIVSVLMLLITQKRRDMGAFMAMGMSPYEVRQMFTRVGLILSGMGMGGGLIIGVSLALFMDAYPLDLLPDIYYESSIPAKVEFNVVAVVALGSALLAWLGSSLPVWVYGRFQPADALRGNFEK